MPSSIFNFDLPRSALRWPRVRHLRHAALLAAFAATYLACLRLLALVFGDARPATTRSLAVQALSPRTEAIFLGNSVVEAAIDSSRYDRPVMALPMANGNYEIDEMILRRHLPDLAGLRLIVLQDDVMCLGWDRLGISLDFSAFHELGLSVRAVPRPAWWHARQRMIEHPWVYPMLFGERLTPRQLIWAPIYGGRMTRPEPGYARLVGVLTEEARSAYFAQPAPPEPLLPEVIRKNRESFRRIGELAGQRGLRVILLRYPSRGGYNFFATDEWRRVAEEFERDLREGGPLHVPGLVRLDLADDPAFVTADFRDTVHLNQRGAATLAAILNARLEEWLGPGR